MARTKLRSLYIAVAISLLAFPQANAQTANGRVTTSAPTYTNGTSAPLSLDTSGALRVTSGGGGSPTEVVGDSAAAAADSGSNPVKIGGIYLANRPTYSDGNRGNVQIDNRGNLRTLGALVDFLGIDNFSNAALGLLSRPNADNYQLMPPAANYLFNGTNWDRARGDVSNGALVNLGSNNDVVIGAAIPAGTNNIGDVDIASSLPSGSNLIGTVTAVPTSSAAATLNHSAIMANTTNATSVKASAGTLFELSVYNNSANIAYLKMYNSASVPTCGSGTPVARYMIPASTDGAGSNVNISLGKSFATGIAYCVTGAIGDSDTTAVAANSYIVNLTYK